MVVAHITNVRFGNNLFLGSLAELNSISNLTPGIAEQNKALVVDGLNDISNINHLSANELTVGELTVTGITQNLNTDGVVLRAYSSDDLQGRMIKKDVILTIDLTDYNPIGQLDYYSLEIIGYIKPLYTETYTFKLTANDKIRFWVDNKLLFNHWVNTNLVDVATDTVSLTAGIYYPIYIQTSEYTGIQTLTVKWESISQALEIIPSTQLAWDDRLPSIKNEQYFGNSITIYNSDSIVGYKSSTLETDTSGNLIISTIGGNICIDNSQNIDIKAHDGVSKGLKLAGILVTSTANEINYLSGITIGTALQSKALILDASSDISGINSLSAVNLTGTLQTVAQPNITSVGVLNSFTSNGLITFNATTPSTNSTTGGLKLAGGIAISNIIDAVSTTNGGTFTSAGGGAFAKTLYVGGNIITNDITGTLLTPAQPNITSVGTLTSLVLSGTISGITTLTATTVNVTSIGGTLTTPAQPNVTSVGTLTSLTLSGTISGITTLSATDINGTLLTVAQPNITSVGILTSVTSSGIIDSSLTTNSTNSTTGAVTLAGGLSISNITDATDSTNGGTFTSAGGGSFAKTLYVGGNIITNNITGTLQTAAQPNITSVGTLTSLVLSGTISGVTTLTGTTLNATTLGGTLSTAAQPNITSVGTLTSLVLSGTISGVTTLTATDINGTLLTVAQPNVTSVGILTNLTTSGIIDSTLTTVATNSTTGSLKLAGGIAISNTTEAVSEFNGGTFTSAGGGAFAKSLYVGLDMTVGGDLNVLGTTTTVNSTTIEMDDNTLLLNNGPSGTGYDSGIQIKRHQNDNALGTGDIVSDTLAETYALSAAASTTITLPAGGNAADDYYNNWWIKITDGSAIDQVRQITDYNGTTKVATIGTAFDTIPSASDNVNLYDKVYTAIVWNESNQRFKVAFTDSFSNSTILNINQNTDFECDNLNLTSTSSSTSNITGAIQLVGGIGISNTTDSTSSTNGGTFTSAGGGAFAKSLYVGGDVTTTNITGTLLTVSQPNITSVGTLTGLVLSGTISGITTLTATDINGTLLTVAQPNVTSVGTLTGLTTSGNLVCTSTTSSTSNSTGVIQLAGGIGISNTTDVTNSTNGGSLTSAGGGAFAKSLHVGGNITTTNITGTLLTNTQPNVTSVGTLTSLTSSGIINSTLSTPSSSSTVGAIKSSGGISISNNTDATSNTNGGTLTSAGGGAFAKSLYVGGNIITNNVTGTLLTAAQPNITSVGTLVSLGITGLLTAGTFTASSLGGTLTTAAQPNITSVGTLTSITTSGVINSSLNTTSISNTTGAVKLTGGIAISHTTDAVNSTNGGTLTSAGGGAFAKSLYVGGNITTTNITGTLLTAIQPNITNVGTLNYLDLAGPINGITTLTTVNIIATNIQGQLTSASQPNITSLGTLTSLIMSGDITGVDDITTNTITANDITGTLLTVAQPNITSVGTLTGLVLSGTISGVTTLTATTLAGTLSTVAQPNITSVGTLTSLVLSGAISGVTTLTATTLAGTLSTVAQPNITSIGTLTSLTSSGVINSTLTTTTTSSTTGAVKLAGGISISNTTESISEFNGGTFTSAGGGAFAKSLFVGLDLTVGGDLTVLGTTNTINSTVTEIDDNIILLNNGPSGTNYDSGIFIKRYQNENATGDGDVVADSLTETYLLDGATSTTITLPAGSSSVNEYYFNWWIKITDGAAINQVRQITAYNGTTKIITINSAFGTTPSAGDTVNLFNKVHTAFIWQESANRFLTCFTDSEYNSNMVDIIEPANMAVENCEILSTTISTSNSTGALQLVGGIGISNTTDAVSSTNGGTLTSAGGGAFAKSLFIGGDITTTNITGILLTAAQTNITSVGSLVSLDVTGALTVGSFSCANLGGTLSTAAQPNVTTVGTLTNLDVAGTLTVGTFNTTNFSGTIITPAQPYITSVGTLDSLDVSGALNVGTFNAINLGGTITTAAQPNITSVGVLSSLNVSGNLTAGSLTINTLNYVVASFSGTLNTAAQPNITSLGTLNILELSGPITGITTLTAMDINGTILTVAQPNITSLGTLTSLTTSGIIDSTSTTASTNTTTGALKLAGGLAISNTTDAVDSTNGGTLTSGGGGAFAKSLFVGNTLTANDITGTLNTAAQPNITSVGTLTGLTLSGTLNATDIAGTLTTVAQPNVTSLGTLNELNISGITTISNTTISTSDTIGALKIAGGISISNTTDAFDETNGGTFTSAGGGAFAKSLYVGDNLLVSGDLIINGTTTTIDSQIISLADNIILLNAGPSGVNADTGFLSERYQTENETGYGDIVNDIPTETYTIVSATSTQIVLPFGSSSTTDFYKNWWVRITSGTAVDHVRKILSYNKTTRTITLVNTFSTIPQPGDTIGLLSKVYAACIYNESNGRYIIGYTASDANSSFVEINNFADVSINCLISNCTKSSTDADTGSLLLYGGIAISNTTDSVSSINGGTLTSAGGGAFAKSLFVGGNITTTNITGTLLTAAQPNITSIGTLPSLNLTGAISGVTTLTATTLAGTLSTVAQPNITSVGTLTSLTLSGTLSGTDINGTILTAAQPNITSVGSLTGLQVNGNITLTGTIDGRDISTDGVTNDNHISDTNNPHNVDIDDVTPTTTKGDLMVENGTNVIRLPVGSNNYVLTANSAEASGVKWTETIKPLNAIIRDVKSTGVNGGSFYSGSWKTRDLNNLNDPDSIIVSLSSNIFTLSAGKYKISVSCQAYEVCDNQLRLYNTSDSTTVTYGLNAYADKSSTTVLHAIINITSNKSYKIEHRCKNSRSTDGFGESTDWGDEVYSIVEITKY